MTVQAPTPAELAARIELARLASAEYGRQLHDPARPLVDYRDHANALNAGLAALLLALDGLASHTGLSGVAFIAPRDVGLVLVGLADAAAWREQLGEVAAAGRYAALAHALGTGS